MPKQKTDVAEHLGRARDMVNVSVGTWPRSSRRVGPMRRRACAKASRTCSPSRRLGVGGRLAASLTNTNCIESMISIARDTTKNVQRWRDGKTIKRWCAAGMLNAERSFRRLKGYRQMPRFVAALARHLEAVPPACDAARVA
jgi:hypothetical protein